jgi:hypothetical protein
MLSEADETKFRKQFDHTRTHFNQNNPIRTDWYRKYWIKHPEVPWAGLAHLVSRNAGYQMSDLKRYVEWTRYGGAALQLLLSISPTLRVLVSPLAVDVAKTLVISTLQGLFQLLETGNYLIFHDIAPQLAAYEAAKKSPAMANDLFDLLLPIRPPMNPAPGTPDFMADDWAINQWKTFFSASQVSGWFAGTWNQAPAVQTMSFALITNEQNQIEDRLVKNTSTRYINRFRSGMDIMFDISAELGLTRLAFPQVGINPPAASRLLLYTVGDFRLLEERIHCSALQSSDRSESSRLGASVCRTPRHPSGLQPAGL